MRMRPLAFTGWLLIGLGTVLLISRGISYTKERQSVQVGTVEIAAERKGIIPPVAGVTVVIVGAALVFASRRRS